MSEPIIPERNPVDGKQGPGEAEAGSEPELSAKQLTLLARLVSDPDMGAAAKAVGISRATAYRWLRQPAFRDELARRREDFLSQALGDVKAHAGLAVTTLSQLLRTADERLRRQVCNDILERAMKIRELEDFERRLVALEKTVERNERKGMP